MPLKKSKNESQTFRRDPFSLSFAASCYAKHLCQYLAGTPFSSYAAALNPIPARLLLERRNVAGSQLRVVDFSKFRGKPVLVLTGTNDLGHARAVDEPIADWLNANGAEADFIYLGDLGITGNGHMLMLERNSDALAQLIIDWIES